ncbi:MAG TPA: FHA domain-containing protein [Isosphaeraceae bacterium]|nr:FHA domain-containing protein [Isosphaeraceae bacterium]
MNLSANTTLLRMYELAISGALGAVFGLFLDVELVQTGSLWLRDALAGVLIGGALGFVLNAVEPLRDGALIRLSRKGAVGAVAGAVGGSLGLLVGEFVLGGFQGGLIGRACSWAILGLGIGVSQALADRSWQRLLFGVLGGVSGGFLGGFSFEALRQALGNRYDLSQSFGMVLLGGGLGLCLAAVEQALKRAWVVVRNGRQEGRSYLLTRGSSVLGLDEHVEIGLFGDPKVARRHAEIVRMRDKYELRNHDAKGRTRVNGEVVELTCFLSDGDRIELGQTLLTFRRR